MSKKTLGERIRDERQHRNMSQQTLSQETKTLQKQINAMENGKPGFSLEKLELLVDYLGVEASRTSLRSYYEVCHEKKAEPVIPEPKKVSVVSWRKSGMWCPRCTERIQANWKFCPMCAGELWNHKKG